jgi:hypothetical protein
MAAFAFLSLATGSGVAFTEGLVKGKWSAQISSQHLFA